MATNFQPEGGIRNFRVEYIEETDRGVFPSDPDLNKVSDEVREVSFNPDANIEGNSKLGSADNSSHNQGAESHSLDMTYELFRDFVDGSDNPNDLSAYGMERNVDQEVQSTLSVLAKMQKEDNTKRLFWVAKGVVPGQITIPGEAGQSDPIMINASLTGVKIREYKVEQNFSGQMLCAKSADSGDTMNLTLEDEGVSTTDTLTLSGTSLVSTSNDYNNLHSFELASEAQGLVEIFTNSGTQASPQKDTKVTEIPGKNQYQNVGDLGVPAMGSGSHGSDIGGSPYRFQGLKVERPNNTDAAARVSSAELSINNNPREEPRVDDITQSVFLEGRNAQASLTVYGQHESHTQLKEHLQATEDDLHLKYGGGSGSNSPGTIVLQNATMIDYGGIDLAPQESITMIDTTFEGKGVNVKAP